MAHGPDINWLGDRWSAGGGLADAEIKALAALPHIVRGFEPGQYLLREGDRPKFCTYLQRGFAYRHKIVGDGGRQIVSLHLAGDFIDAQNVLLDQADHNIQALTDTVMLLIPINELMAVASVYPTIARALWRETLVEASITREWVANIGRRDARVRTAHLLCEMAIRCGGPGRARDVRPADDAGTTGRRAGTDGGTHQPHAEDTESRSIDHASQGVGDDRRLAGTTASRRFYFELSAFDQSYIVAEAHVPASSGD